MTGPDHPGHRLAGAPDLLTVAEAASILRVSRNHAYELARRGRLPTVRLGRSLRVPRAALSRLLEETAHPTWPKGNQPG